MYSLSRQSSLRNFSFQLRRQLTANASTGIDDLSGVHIAIDAPTLLVELLTAYFAPNGSIDLSERASAGDISTNTPTIESKSLASYLTSDCPSI